MMEDFPLLDADESLLFSMIVEFIKLNGYAPSIYRLTIGAKSLGFTGDVCDLMDRLEMKKYLRFSISRERYGIHPDRFMLTILK